jgi:hypothetical protein
MPMLTTSVNGPPSAAAIRRRGRRGRSRHRGEHRLHVGHDVAAVHQTGSPERLRKRGVEDGAAFGEVDRLAGEHRVAPGGDAAGLGELDEVGERLGVDAGLGDVEQHVVERDRELAEAVGVALEERWRCAGRAPASPAASRAFQIASLIAASSRFSPGRAPGSAPVRPTAMQDILHEGAWLPRSAAGRRRSAGPGGAGWRHNERAGARATLVWPARVRAGRRGRSPPPAPPGTALQVSWRARRARRSAAWRLRGAVIRGGAAGSPRGRGARSRPSGRPRPAWGRRPRSRRRRARSAAPDSPARS